VPITDRFRQQLRREVSPEMPSADAAALAHWIAEQAAGTVVAVVFFGSRKHRASPQSTSAHDLLVVTRAYLAFYRALRKARVIHRSPRLLAGLNHLLAPNQLSIRTDVGRGPMHAKCAAVSLDRLRRETSRRRRDQFIAGRLFQPAEIVYAEDEGARDVVVDCIVSAHALTYEWARPWLPPAFDASDYGRALLRISFGHEIRPEPTGRAEALWQAQQEYFRSVYGTLLEDLLAAGELCRREGSYSLANPVSVAERLRGEAFLRWSLVRATARWAKHVVTFEGWLEFILGKARRHSGAEIVLSPRERRLPLLFLWPRLIRYLRHKDK
jgi:hypothetical protein